MRKRKSYPEQYAKEASEMRYQGATLDQIAAALGISRRSVGRALDVAGVPRPGGGRRIPPTTPLPDTEPPPSPWSAIEAKVRNKKIPHTLKIISDYKAEDAPLTERRARVFAYLSTIPTTDLLRIERKYRRSRR